MEQKSSFTSYVAAWVSVTFGSVSLDRVAVWIGIVTAIGTFALNWYYKAREDRRQEGRRGNS